MRLLKGHWGTIQYYVCCDLMQQQSGGSILKNADQLVAISVLFVSIWIQKT